MQQSVASNSGLSKGETPRNIARAPLTEIEDEGTHHGGTEQDENVEYRTGNR
jgi:hypothetical protein